MRIKLNLMGSLRDRKPPGDGIELSPGATVADLLDVLDIPNRRVQVVSVNNSIEHDRDRGLADGDQVTILPAVVGG